MDYTQICGAAALIGLLAASANPARSEVLAEWRFEQVQREDGTPAPAAAGEALTARRGRAANPRPYLYDGSGKGNVLQLADSNNQQDQPPAAFSDSVPASKPGGDANKLSLALNGRDYTVSLDRLLPFTDMRKGWTIEASVMTNAPDGQQVFLSKNRTSGAQASDLAIGYDSSEKSFYLEIKGGDGEVHRVATGPAAEVGKWHDVRAKASYDAEGGKTNVTFAVKPSDAAEFDRTSEETIDGPALPKGVATWAVGRGAGNRGRVTDGGIDEVRISGEGLPRADGQNPIFTDTFTADPAASVFGETVYAYVGHDAAKVGQFFVMPEWLCYSSTDMRNWTAHGTVMRPEEFQFARPGVAWAAQTVKANDKYYFYVTLRQRTSEEHCIGVAVADTPLGPFKDARGTPLITDGMTTDSRRPNADIDPTVFIDDDGTPWMAWGNGDCYLVKLKKNMTEMDGPIRKLDLKNYAEGPWLFKRGDLYYNVYAADVPGTQPEQIAYSTAPSMEGPWSYRGLVTGPAQIGFTIHPAVIQFKGQWYFFYHDGSTPLAGMPGGDCRRSVCVEYLYFNDDGTIQPITQTSEGVGVPSKPKTHEG